MGEPWVPPRLTGGTLRYPPLAGARRRSSLYANDFEERSGARGAADGNGRAVLPPGAATPMSVYRQPPRAPSFPARAHGSDRALARCRVPRRRRRRRRRRVPLLPRVGGRGRGEDSRGQEGGTIPAGSPARPAGGRARHRLRPPQDGRRGRAVALGHADARARGSRHRVDLADVVPARPPGRDPLPRPAAVHRQDRARVHGVRAAGLAEHGQEPHGAPDQLPDHRQLPGLPPDRRPARRRLDGRRPPLLQRPQRPLRLRDDQPLARLPAAHGTEGARLRPLPPYRLRPLPRRAPAAVREGVQEPDPGELRPDRAAEDRQRDHEQRRGRPGRRRRRRRPHGALVRALRVRAAEGPRLPDEDRGDRGLRRAHDRARERHARGPDLHAPRRRVLGEGDRGRARRADQADARPRPATRASRC